MTDLTPADLAKFIHPVPVGAVIPAGTPYAYRAGAQIGIRSQGMPYESTQVDANGTRWTAEPIRTPESLAEKARAIAEEGAPGGPFERLARLVAELAERIEAKP